MTTVTGEFVLASSNWKPRTI